MTNFLLNEDQMLSFADCTSASEFLLKLSVLGDDFRFSSEDFYDMLELLPDKPLFISVLSELISDYSIFDSLILEPEVGLDYCIASFFKKIDDNDYKRFKIITYFSSDSPSWGWRNSNFYSNEEKMTFNSNYQNLLLTIIQKIEKNVGIDIPSVMNFKKLITA